MNFRILLNSRHFFVSATQILFCGWNTEANSPLLTMASELWASLCDLNSRQSFIQISSVQSTTGVNIDSDHLCYIYLAIYYSPAGLSYESIYLVPWVLPLKLVQKTCTKLWWWFVVQFNLCTTLFGTITIAQPFQTLPKRGHYRGGLKLYHSKCFWTIFE